MSKKQKVKLPSSVTCNVLLIKFNTLNLLIGHLRTKKSFKDKNCSKS